jgi:2-amino-4-hydroxy-6-hydroxymethyldihydropteridine diphosphokinase
MTARAFIGLGSNLGDRDLHLQRAIAALRDAPDVEVVRVSSVYETAPVGGSPGQGPYLNAALKLQTTRTPVDLLHLLLQIEADLGRERLEQHGPRTIDLDLLLYEQRAFSTPELTVPHPRLHERLFVLVPLAEIGAGVRHPVLGRTIGELLFELQGLRRHSLASGELEGKVALVTGSTRGIGRAIALELARAGAQVFVHGRDREAAERVVGEIRAAEGDALPITADLRQPADSDALADTAQHLGPVRILVNNAGADVLTGEAARWSFEQKLQALWEVDVQATIRLSRLLGRWMKEHGGGVILNMGWDHAERGMEGDSGEMFAAAKGAVMAFTRSLALSLAPEVRVHCLAPGWIRTAWGEQASQEWQERVKRETPLGRWGTPEDVAATARWLVSPTAAFLHGQIVRVDGGAVR